MSDIAEALLDAFHSDARLIWDAKGASQVAARFEIGGSRVKITFRETAKKDWEVGYTIAAARIKSAMESLSDSLRIVGDVLQAVTESWKSASRNACASPPKMKICVSFAKLT